MVFFESQSADLRVVWFGNVIVRLTAHIIKQLFNCRIEWLCTWFNKSIGHSIRLLKHCSRIVNIINLNDNSVLIINSFNKLTFFYNKTSNKYYWNVMLIYQPKWKTLNLTGSNCTLCSIKKEFTCRRINKNGEQQTAKCTHMNDAYKSPLPHFKFNGLFWFQFVSTLSSLSDQLYQ